MRGKGQVTTEAEIEGDVSTPRNTKTLNALGIRSHNDQESEPAQGPSQTRGLLIPSTTQAGLFHML